MATFIIITASYKRPNELQRNISAMLQQSHSNWLQIIVDDGSGIPEIDTIITKMSRQDPRIINLPLSENSGCNKARNHALNYISQHKLSGYISIVDDDDFLLADALEKAENHICKHPRNKWHVLSNCSPEGNSISQLKRYGELSYINNAMTRRIIKGDSTHFFHSDLLNDKLRFTTDFRNGQEWYFWCLLSKQSSLYASDITVKVVQYLEEGLSLTRANQINKLLSQQLKVTTLKGLVSRRELSKHQLALAREQLTQEHYNEALCTLRKIAKYQFLNIKFARYFVRSYLSKMKTILN